ncbi:thiamine-monophosphate kinase [Salinibacillus kushneri]|uniref:Thiamine-monophosphate kinase n=1 Tax=Salinibacillus kushneri TaxID=237682 RepID=A0A1I0J4S3_9BACI|nr:thiamine-phosphate kinase [Salinibacillus kushneri]SEU04777.1 thiamine-monophosphate kinase [Salinibacillus kushneri]
MDEFSFIDSITQKYYRQSSLIKGIGDDAAVVRPVNGFDMITASDTMVEGIHFRLTTMNPYHIGYRILGANLSDLAAMGCDPAYYMVSIVIPKNWSQKQLEEVYSGMHDHARQYQMDLIGGDTVSGNELVITVTVYGYVPKNRSRYRSYAYEGDYIFVTGHLGDSAYGLHLLLEQKKAENRDYFIRRHQMPNPRVHFAQELQSLKRLCLNDVSDGIASEANEIAQASRISLELNYSAFPIRPEIKQYSLEDQKKWVLSGGEDFELLGTVAKEDWVKVQAAADKTNTKVTNIGVVKESRNNPQVLLIQSNGQKEKLKRSGYVHL